jgi:hypothetical protein
LDEADAEFGGVHLSILARGGGARYAPGLGAWRLSPPGLVAGGWWFCQFGLGGFVHFWAVWVRFVAARGMDATVWIILILCCI